MKQKNIDNLVFNLLLYQMELLKTTIVLQMAWYFNRADNVNHPTIKISILNSLFRKVSDGEYFKFENWKYYLTDWKREFNNYWSVELYVKEFINKNFNQLLTKASQDPMLFIR